MGPCPHWRLWAIVWGPVSTLKSHDGGRQHYVPRATHSHRRLASPGDPPRPAGTFGPGFYQITASAPGPSARGILCVSFRSEASLSPSPVGLLRLSSAGLRTQMLWGVLFPVLDPQAGEPDVGLRTLAPAGEPLPHNYSPVRASPHLGAWDLITS